MMVGAAENSEKISPAPHADISISDTPILLLVLAPTTALDHNMGYAHYYYLIIRANRVSLSSFK
jgi:hypothetical protein